MQQPLGTPPGEAPATPLESVRRRVSSASPSTLELLAKLFRGSVGDRASIDREATSASSSESASVRTDELNQLFEELLAVAASLPREAPTTSYAEQLRAVHGSAADPGIALESCAEGGESRSHGVESTPRGDDAPPDGGIRSRYRIEGVLGRGGMGVVYSVWDHDLRRHVAMKVIRGTGELDASPSELTSSESSGGAADASLPQARLDPTRLRRFLEEAHLTAQLAHPGIVPVHEIGLDADGAVYFTMRQVRGATFADVIEWVHGTQEASEVGWNETRAILTLVAVCDALAYAHTKGVVHRDLKPANVMVGRFGETYVMDWGAARIEGPGASPDAIAGVEQDRASDARISPLRTRNGVIVGTPNYMSPEQAMGRIDLIDVRSDVYAVGTMLYHLLTGEAPYSESFGPADQSTILDRLRAGPPRSVHSFGKPVPAELEAICDKAMARTPSARYPDMQALATDLRAYLEHRVVGAYRTGAVAELRKWVERNTELATSLAAAVVLAVGAMGFIAWERTRHSHEMEVKTQDARIARKAAEDALVENQRLTDSSLSHDLQRRARELLTALPAQVPDIKHWIADAEEVTSRSDHYQQQLSELRTRALPPDASPDSVADPSGMRTPRISENLRRRLAFYEERIDANASEIANTGREIDDTGRAIDDQSRVLADTRRAFAGTADATKIRGMEDAVATLDKTRSTLEKRRRYLEDARVLLERERGTITRELSESDVGAHPLPLRFHNDEDQRLHDDLADVVTVLGELLKPMTAPDEVIAAWGASSLGSPIPEAFVASAGTLPAMRHRLVHADWVKRVSFDEYADAWRDARRRIAANPKYRGLDLKEQIGLVPIATDPASGLEEFWSIETGACPNRSQDDGAVTMDDAAGIVFVLLPGGPVIVGSRLPDADHPTGSANVDAESQIDEQPPQMVFMRPFFMSKFEITQAQWLRVAGNNPSYFTGSRNGISYPLTCPVDQVSWVDARAWVERVGFDLPTEAQWEYGARAGTTTVWWVGDQLADIGPSNNGTRCAGNLSDKRFVARKVYSGSPEPWDDGCMDSAPVGQFRPNAFGLHDVIGGVWEWCKDEYLFPFDGFPARDGDGLRSRLYETVVVSRSSRGASWGHGASIARCANRNRETESTRNFFLGLRPVRLVTE